jgi:hypothetical protein
VTSGYAWGDLGLVPHTLPGSLPSQVCVAPRSAAVCACAARHSGAAMPSHSSRNSTAGPPPLDSRRDGRLRRTIAARSLRCCSEERSGCRAEAPCHGSQHSRDPQATGQAGDKSEAATRHGHQQPRCEQLQACRHTATHRKTELTNSKFVFLLTSSPQRRPAHSRQHRQAAGRLRSRAAPLSACVLNRQFEIRRQTKRIDLPD